MKRWFDNTIAITAPGVGVLLREAGGTSSYRARASMVQQRYVGVGLDGSLDLGQPINTWLGVGQRYLHQKFLSRAGYYRAVAGHALLPMMSESIPILFALDAGRGITDPTEKIAAWHRCYNQTLDGYDPDTGVWDGPSEPKNAAYVVSSVVSLLGSKAVSEIAPELNEGLSKFTGGLIKKF